MTKTLKRKLTPDEEKRVLEVHGRKCFATGHEIPVDEKINFDHIQAFALKGKSDLDNIAPMCAAHNKQKGTLSLGDFRVKLRQEEFFQRGACLTLGDLLRYLKEIGDITSFGDSIKVIEKETDVVVSAPGFEEVYRLYECPTTGWKYFYATLPVTLLDSDDDRDDAIGLQPRYLLSDRVFSLFRHFQKHPVLQPSIGRVVGDKIKLFDGQHKIAGLLWTGRTVFECKVYLEHETRLLNQTNISAHDKFAQARFFSSIMVGKLGAQFGSDFDEYKEIEDGEIKSEKNFIDWINVKDGSQVTKAQRSKEFRSYLYNSVLEHPENKVTRLVSKTNRSSDEHPLTMDILGKSIFSCFLYRHPVEDNMASDSYKRDNEVENTVFLLNCLDDIALSAWNGKAGLNDPQQRKLKRLVTSKPMMAWSEVLRDAVCGKLNLLDAEDREAPFYRELGEEQKGVVRSVVERLCGWKLWDSPAKSEIDSAMTKNKGDVKKWFKDKGLTTGYLMGAQE